jgi:hypothetical protein
VKRYRVNYVATVSTCVEVDAEDETAAMDLADQEFDMPQLCHYCARLDMSDWQPDEGKFAVYEIEAEA